jgi:adenosylhomocysteine nucleosidase
MKSVKLLAVAAIAVAAIVVCAAVALQPSKNDQEGRIGVIGAMEVEVKTLKESMSVDYTKTIAGMEFFVGKLDDCDVVVVQCGMGKVNAGTCAQMLITEFNVTAIINTGAAGSLDNRLDIEDFVVSTDAVQHDFDVTPLTSPEKTYVKGEIPYTGKYSFEADKGMRDMAVKAITECAKDVKYMEGRVCSGDQFISTQEQKDTILANFGECLCCEMEGAAIAQICYLNDTPFVIIRAISDKADGSEMEDYLVFEKRAAERSAKVVKYMLWELL